MRHFSVLPFVVVVLLTALFILFHLSIAGEGQGRPLTPDVVEIEKRIKTLPIRSAKKDNMWVRAFSGTSGLKAQTHKNADNLRIGQA
jgi:hypothetical protein